MPQCISGGCLFELFAATWVDVYHAMFANNEQMVQENEELHMTAIKV